jgi:NAD(P)-dependent dehydrogenase (short-subunit alcohol dehydrogenase family)
MSTALITGASRGFGRALARELAARGWRLVLTARTEADLDELQLALPGAVTVRGDVGDAAHREALAAATEVLAPIDLLVNNASELGPSPLPVLARYPIAQLRAVFETNVLAPLALTQLLLPSLAAANGVVVNLSSDAATEPYPGWGGYGSSKAALDQLSAVLGAEEPGLSVYAFDPGDMRTEMHQRAFPGEDISDRPAPESVIPALLALLERRPPSGRYRAVQFARQAVAT